MKGRLKSLALGMMMLMGVTVVMSMPVQAIDADIFFGETGTESGGGSSSGGSNGGSGGSSSSGGGTSASDMTTESSKENEGKAPEMNVLKGVDGIDGLLYLIVDILLYGLGAAATLGVVIAGIMYLTARDNPQQVAKAKTRLVEVAIGLVAWAMLFALLKFLIPGFKFDH